LEKIGITQLGIGRTQLGIERTQLGFGRTQLKIGIVIIGIKTAAPSKHINPKNHCLFKIY